MTMPSVAGTQSRHSVQANGYSSGDFEAQLTAVLEVAYRMAYTLLGNQAGAEALVANAAVRASGERSTLRGGMNFKIWFLGLLTGEFYALEGADSALFAGGGFDGGETSHALGALPVGERVINALHLVGELRYQDIATALDLPVSTVRARLHRGRARIRKVLAWQ